MPQLSKCQIWLCSALDERLAKQSMMVIVWRSCTGDSAVAQQIVSNKPHSQLAFHRPPMKHSLNIVVKASTCCGSASLSILCITIGSWVTSAMILGKSDKNHFLRLLRRQGMLARALYHFKYHPCSLGSVDRFDLANITIYRVITQRDQIRYYNGWTN